MLAVTGAVVGGVLAFSIVILSGAADPSTLGLSMVIGLGVGLATGGVLVVVVVRSLIGTMTSVRDGMWRVVQDRPVSPISSSNGGTADLVYAFNQAHAALEARLDGLRQSRDQFEKILQSVADGVVIVDEDQIVTFMNRAAGFMLAVDVSEAPGRSLVDALRDHELVAICRRAIGGHTVIGDVVAVGGGNLDVDAMVHPIGIGPTKHVLLLLRDLTEVHATAAARRDFVANVSHELRTPITSLKALVESLDLGAADDPGLRTEFLRHIGLEVDRLAAMTSELLDLAAVEASRWEVRLEMVDLGGLVRESVERLRPQADRGGVSLEMTMLAADVNIRVDPGQIDRMVINLLHNAIKFTPPGGHVQVSVRTEDGEAVVRVSDTGEGIDPDALSRVFERFYKTDPSRSRDGAGLGLAIAKHTAMQHGGRILAESDGPGRGAVFTIALPIARSD